MPRAALALLAFALWRPVTGRTPAAQAQAVWTAHLDINPYPSPYLSDWESNPTIGTLTIMNPTGADQPVVLAYRVTDHTGRLLASGRSDPQVILHGMPTVLTDFVDISGRSQHDQALEDQMRRTGRLPEGDNTACVAVTDQGGFVLAEDCATFSVVYPDPPTLVAPLDDEAVATDHPIFQWTPLQVPPTYQLTYVVRVSEVLEGQEPEQALAANIPVFETTTFGTSLEYPVNALPLAEGKTYVWRVQALDQNGYAASAHEGRSEIWTFRLGSPVAGGPVGGNSSFALEVTNTRGGGSLPSSVDTLGLMSICRNWAVTDPTNPNTSVQLGFNSPVAFPDRLSIRAQLHRYNVPGSNSRVWALVGDTPKYRLMAYGDCDGPFDRVPWPQWLGIRSLDGTSTMSFLMGGDTSQTGDDFHSTSPGLEFGVVILTAQELTAAAPAGFEIVREFLEGHEIDLQPGINAFGIWQLQERPFWKFFQALGYGDKEIELQGFLGVNFNASVGLMGATGQGVRGDVSADLQFLNLRAALPRRDVLLPGLSSLFRSSQLEFELAVTDSASVTRAAGDRLHHQFHLLLNFNHHLTLSRQLERALHVNPGAELVSTTGLDLSTEEFTQGSGEVKLVRRYTLDATWTLGQTRFVLGHPELEIGLLLAGEHRGDLMFTLSGSAGWGGQDALGKLAITLARSAAVARSHQPTASLDRMQADLARWQDRLNSANEHLATAATPADSAPWLDEKRIVSGWIAETQEQARSFESLNATRRARAQQAQVVAAQPRCFGLTGWYCTFRLSLGNLGLVDLMSLIREIGTAATR